MSEVKKRYEVYEYKTLINPTQVIPAFKVWDEKREHPVSLGNDFNENPYLTKAEADIVCKYLNEWN